ncbi:PKD domain-containing protein [bacterium]|nr:PKD domain-containing protein [bacterium]
MGVGGLLDLYVFWKVQAFDRDHLQMVGDGYSGVFTFDHQMIFRSDDGGASFEDTYSLQIGPGQPGWLCNSFFYAYDLHFDSYDTGSVFGAWNGGATNCFFIYEHNWVARTSNAGNAWANFVLTPDTDDRQINAVDILPGGVGFAAGSANNIWKTADGGQSWTLSVNMPSTFGPDSPVVDLDVVSSTVAFASSETYLVEDEWSDDDYEEDEDWAGELTGIKGEVFKTDNGGASWTSLRNDPNVGFHAIDFVSGLRGIVLAVNELDGAMQILYTSDGGANWGSGVLPYVPGVGSPGTDYWITAIAMVDAQNGWAVGGDQYGDQAVIIKTTNGGTSWQADDYTGAGRFNDIHMLNERNGFAVGSRHLIARFRIPGASPPIADAGPDRIVPVGTPVTLDGSGSYDPDGDPITYDWSRVSGPFATLQGANTVSPTFTPNTAGTYTFQLVVADYDTTSSPDEVKITASDADDDAADDDALDDDATDDDDINDDDALDDDEGDDDINDDDDLPDDDDAPPVEEADCSDLLSMVYDICDAYFEGYENRVEVESACDEDESPWDCAVECRSQNTTCDGLFECLDEECDFPATRNTTDEGDFDEGDVSGGSCGSCS